MMKFNYKNTQNKLQEDYANWFIEQIKKNIWKKLVSWKFQRILLKTILNEWFQFIYLQNIFFKWFDSISFVFNFQKKKLFTLIVSKEFITKFQFDNKKLFYLLLKKKWMNFYNFIYKSISICFYLRKVIYKNY